MNTDELIEHVTNDLIAAIENGADTWQMPWHTIATNAQPRSIDDRPYRGLNAVVLALTAAANGWLSGIWATYRGWQRHGAQVRRGERATHVLLWKPARPATERDDSTTEPVDGGTSAAPGGRLVSRVFAVFAAEQVDGADSTLTDRDEPRDTPDRIAAADTYFASIGADVITGGNRACYIPADDRIHVPHLSQFEQPALYYSTTCHDPLTAPVGELGHPVGDPCDVIRWGSNGGGCGGIAGGTGNPRRVGSGCRACRSRSTLRWSAGCSSPRRCGRDGARSRRVLAELGSV